MRRRTFDALLTAGGLVLAIVLIIAGSLLTWGHSFVNDQVHSQLAAQKIFFPPKGDAISDPKIKPFLEQYAGQQLVNGAQAEAYANHFIKVHLDEIAGGKTYAELSTLSRAAPDNAELAGQVQTMFRGETLRGLLLNAYAFWKTAQIMYIAAIVSFVGAGLMLLLSVMGFWHLRRTHPEEEIKLGSRIPAPVEP